MASPYSQDPRDRVVSSVASGRSCRAKAALFEVSVAGVVKWSQRWRASGSAAAKPMGGRWPLPLTGERRWLLARIAEKPELTPAGAEAGLYGALAVKACVRLCAFSCQRLGGVDLSKGRRRSPHGVGRSARHGARTSRHTLVFGACLGGRNHDAVMRTSAARPPRRQAHSLRRRAKPCLPRVTAASDRCRRSRLADRRNCVSAICLSWAGRFTPPHAGRRRAGPHQWWPVATARSATCARERQSWCCA